MIYVVNSRRGDTMYRKAENFLSRRLKENHLVRVCLPFEIIEFSYCLLVFVRHRHRGRSSLNPRVTRSSYTFLLDDDNDNDDET